jgi:hypothetical protein
LVVTSPPYGPSTHGQVDTGPGGIHKRDHLYGNLLDRGNLANIGHLRLLAGFTRILTIAARYLRPGGHVVITVRPWREHAELIDLPARSPPAAATPASPRSSGVSPCSAGSPTPGGSSRTARSSNATSSAANANAACPYTSSPTRTSSSSNARSAPPLTGAEGDRHLQAHTASITPRRSHPGSQMSAHANFRSPAGGTDPDGRTRP